MKQIMDHERVGLLARTMQRVCDLTDENHRLRARIAELEAASGDPELSWAEAARNLK